jgi:hypothetical protein
MKMSEIGKMVFCLSLLLAIAVGCDQKIRQNIDVLIEVKVTEKNGKVDSILVDFPDYIRASSKQDVRATIDTLEAVTKTLLAYEDRMAQEAATMNPPAHTVERTP